MQESQKISEMEKRSSSSNFLVERVEDQNQLTFAMAILFIFTLRTASHVTAFWQDRRRGAKPSCFHKPELRSRGKRPYICSILPKPLFDHSCCLFIGCLGIVHLACVIAVVTAIVGEAQSALAFMNLSSKVEVSVHILVLYFRRRCLITVVVCL